MVTTNLPGFDSGPLTWVRAEIENSLTSAKTHFDELAKDPADSKAVQYAALCMHQVTGALSMVSLGAAARLSEEIEKLIAAFAVAVPADATHQLAAAKSASASLSAYLDQLMAGQPDRPMTLAQTYISLNRARGANDASPTDLFSPDLSATVPLPDDVAPPLGPEQFAEAVRQARSLFPAGLPKLPRDKDLVPGPRTQPDAVLAIGIMPFHHRCRSLAVRAPPVF